MSQKASDIDVQTLDALEGVEWPPSKFGSYVVTRVHRLRSVPLKQYSLEDLRLMIGQQVGLRRIRGHSCLLTIQAGCDSVQIMPRTGRKAPGGWIYHVLNRGNSRSDLFHKDGDWAAFEKLLFEVREAVPLRILAWRPDKGTFLFIDNSGRLR